MLALVCGAALWSPRPAAAYSIAVHSALSRLSAQGRIGNDELPPPSQGELLQFYQWLGAAMAEGGDTEGQAGFRARYRGPRDFNARGVRRFLGLTEDPAVRVWGVSRVHPSGTFDRVALLREASTWPDLDLRNQRRMVYDDQGEPVRLPDGRPVPFDPMVLNLGGLEGLASQAHAHYALPGAVTPTSDPEVLRKEPWRFAVAAGFDAPVESFAADMAELHLDMAILARVWGETSYHASGEYLAMVWLGAGLHYLQDAAGPLHTVQVGSYTLFKRAKIAWYLRALLSGGGYLSDLPSFVEMGLDLLHNHHIAGERWLAWQLQQLEAGGAADPAVALAVQNARGEDKALAHEVDAALNVYLKGPEYVEPWEGGRGAGTILVEALARIGSRQGGALYEALAEITAPALSAPGARIADEGTDLTGLFRDPDDPAVRAKFGEMAAIQAASVQRAVAAGARYLQAYHAGNGDTAARRLRAGRLRHLAQAEARRAAWLKAPPPASGAAETHLGFFALALGLILGATWLLVRVTRPLWRRRTGPG